jgi:hypothetical protein
VISSDKTTHNNDEKEISSPDWCRKSAESGIKTSGHRMAFGKDIMFMM